MKNHQDKIFRVTYEAFSKFSASLYACHEFEDVARCLRTHLKFLFNYQSFRVNCQLEDTRLTIKCGKKDWEILPGHETVLFNYEKELLKSGIPIRIKYPDDSQNVDFIKEPLTESGTLWAWLFTHTADRKLIISIFTSPQDNFSNRDIIFVKLIADILEAKLFELNLIKKLDKANVELTKALDTIKQKNQAIRDIVHLQKQTILQRTKELAEKNSRLLDISLLNAHSVREPLTRIMGLMDLLEEMDMNEFRKEVVPHLKESTSDLDTALQKVIEQTSINIQNYKA